MFRVSTITQEKFATIVTESYIQFAINEIFATNVILKYCIARKFGGLVDYLCDHQIKISQYFILEYRIAGKFGGLAV